MTLAADASIEQLIERLAARRVDIITTLELMQGYRENVTTGAAEMENPQAVQEYLAYFTTLFATAADDCGQIAADLTTEGIKREHIVTLKKLSGSGTLEQRRCLQFRDKWINKPLPHESLRPLLNDISITTRDQLTALKDLFEIASRLATLFHTSAASPAPAAQEERTFDRRALFTRFLKR